MKLWWWIVLALVPYTIQIVFLSLRFAAVILWPWWAVLIPLIVLAVIVGIFFLQYWLLYLWALRS